MAVLQVVWWLLLPLPLLVWSSGELAAALAYRGSARPINAWCCRYY